MNYLNDRNRFGPTTDELGRMPPGNVLVGGNKSVDDQAPNYEPIPCQKLEYEIWIEGQLVCTYKGSTFENACRDAHMACKLIGEYDRHRNMLDGKHLWSSRNH